MAPKREAGAAAGGGGGAPREEGEEEGEEGGAAAGGRGPGGGRGRRGGLARAGPLAALQGLPRGGGGGEAGVLRLRRDAGEDQVGRHRRTERGRLEAVEPARAAEAPGAARQGLPPGHLQ